MAFVNLNTEEIYGCEEGSYTWWHEKGHIYFNKSLFGNNLNFWKGNILICSIGIIIFGCTFNIMFFKLLSTSLFILYFLMYLIEEIWCWKYAFENKKVKGGIK